jgi:hypothetical protein
MTADDDPLESPELPEPPEKGGLRRPSRPPPPGPPRVSWPRSARIPKPLDEPAKPRSRPGTMRHGPPPA